MPKPKKVGRPKMAKGQAKATIMPVRLSPEDRKRIEKAAKAKNQTVSQWVRGTLNAALDS
jgi:predicted HicB family RNase H-like nuclease